MKKIFLAFLCSSSLVACQTKYDGYILNGNIGGNSEGMKVQLVNEAVYPPVTIDSTVIKNGRFQLKGKVDRPGMYQLIIDKTGQDDPNVSQPVLPGKFGYQLFRSRRQPAYLLLER